jgi:hypothetical protein
MEIGLSEYREIVELLYEIDGPLKSKMYVSD